LERRPQPVDKIVRLEVLAPLLRVAHWQTSSHHTHSQVLVYHQTRETAVDPQNIDGIDRKNWWVYLEWQDWLVQGKGKGWVQ
jgi:hypothetical protein